MVLCGGQIYTYKALLILNAEFSKDYKFCKVMAGGARFYTYAPKSTCFLRLLCSFVRMSFQVPIMQQYGFDFSNTAIGVVFCPFVHSDVVVEYEEAMKKLAEKLTWLVLASLGISNQDIQWAGPRDGGLQGACAALQLNSYPTCPDPDRAMGLAAHTDSTILTILYQNAISGLQVLKEGTGWVTVPPLPGGLVINIGDLLHILSNGLYPSVLHRVLVNRTQQRLSAAYLYGPPAGVKISPHPKVVGPSRPPLYRPVTWHEYLGTKAKHFNEALSCVRVCGPKNAMFADGNDTHGHGHNNNNNSVPVG